MGKLGCIDSDHSEVSVRIVADELRRTIAAIRDVHHDPGGMMDDMAVGQNEAVRRDHKSGSASGNIPRPVFDALLDLDVHNSRRDPRDCAYDRTRIFVEQQIIRGNVVSACEPRAILRLRLTQQAHRGWLVLF